MFLAPKNVGKWIRVRGAIARIIPPENDRPAVLELEVKPGSALSCELDDGFWKPDTFRAGESVQLVGKVAEGADPSNVRLLRCDVVSQGPLPVVPPDDATIEVTATDMIRAALDDPKAAGAKYAGKTIRVTGTVEQLPMAGIIQLAGPPDGDTKTGVYMRFGAEAREALTDVEVGDTVSVVGTFTVIGGAGPNQSLFAKVGEVRCLIFHRCKPVK